MILYKLGSIWGTGAPDFYEMIKNKNISLSHIGDCNPKKDSIILITKGHTVKAITILLEDCQPVTNNPELKNSFDEYNISYNIETLYARSKWIELKPQDYFLFKTQDGICRIHKQEIHQITKSLISKYMSNENLNKNIDLLKYKKQIILQGPPGTGKTRLAKELAKVLIGEQIIKEKPSKINNTDIERYLKVGLEISSVKEKAIYTITEITPNNVRLTLAGGKTYSPNFLDIKKWYTNKKWDIKGEQTNQLDPYNAALAKYIHDNIEDIENKIDFTESNQFKLIQFHPSYTYEDFVRGIVSKPNENGEGIIFKTENKIIAEFAEKALKNKLNSKKGAAELSKEKWVHEQFEQFIYDISEDIEKKEKIELTESVYIVELDDDAFRYKGLEGWTKRGNRMLFNDIKQAYLDENSDRQDLIHNDNLSGLAKWHASYYIRVLDMFRKFLNDNNLNFIADNSDKEELINYVLIIDEINRANLPSVLGELIYALEYRDELVDSIYEYEGKREIILPSNLFIIGTMNTADRSVGHLDYAIRRRFAFMDILPKDLSEEEEIIFDSPLFHSVKEFFTSDDYKTRSNYLSTDFEPKDVALGHSYFIDKKEDGGSMNIRLEYEIKPILREYIKDGILKEIVREKIEQLSTTI
ncbi:AAA family ATPase [Flavobacterium sp. FlaQc-47]|uniref:AAA family ATPase n=1 Tax=Flavobacterium sp. FlaQc-47 TaxID=3374180 RepID=UPI0037570133